MSKLNMFVALVLLYEISLGFRYISKLRLNSFYSHFDGQVGSLKDSLSACIIPSFPLMYDFSLIEAQLAYTKLLISDIIDEVR